MGIVGRRRFKKWVREVSDRIEDAIESVADGDLVREMDVAFELNSEGCLDPRVLRVQVRVERYGTIENLPEKPAEIPLGTASAESGADPAVSGETPALLGAPGDPSAGIRREQEGCAKRETRAKWKACQAGGSSLK